jgi:hypothetical protein
MPANVYPDGFPMNPLEAINFCEFLSAEEKQGWQSWLATADDDQKKELVDTLHSIYLDQQDPEVASLSDDFLEPSPFGAQTGEQTNQAFFQNNFTEGAPEQGMNLNYNPTSSIPGFGVPEQSFGPVNEVYSPFASSDNTSFPPFFAPPSSQEDFYNSVSAAGSDIYNNFTTQPAISENIPVNNQKKIVPEEEVKIPQSPTPPPIIQNDPKVGLSAASKKSTEEEKPVKEITPPPAPVDSQYEDNNDIDSSFISALNDDDYRTTEQEFLKELQQQAQQPPQETFEPPQEDKENRNSVISAPKKEAVEQKNDRKTPPISSLPQEEKKISPGIYQQEQVNPAKLSVPVQQAPAITYQPEESSVPVEEDYLRKAEDAFLSANEVSDLYNHFLEIQNKSVTFEKEFQMGQAKLFNKIMDMVKDASILNEKFLRLNDRTSENSGKIQELFNQTSVRSGVSLQQQVNTLRTDMQRSLNDISFKIEALSEEFVSFRTETSQRLDEMSKQQAAALGDVYKAEGIKETMASILVRLKNLEGGNQSGIKSDKKPRG